MLELLWFLNMRFRGKLISMCGNINTKKFLVPPLGLAHVLCDDLVFLIMGIVKVTRMPSTMRARC